MLAMISTFCMQVIPKLFSNLFQFGVSGVNKLTSSEINQKRIDGLVDDVIDLNNKMDNNQNIKASWEYKVLLLKHAATPIWQSLLVKLMLFLAILFALFPLSIEYAAIILNLNGHHEQYEAIAQALERFSDNHWFYLSQGCIFGLLGIVGIKKT